MLEQSPDSAWKEGKRRRKDRQESKKCGRPRRLKMQTALKQGVKDDGNESRVLPRSGSFCNLCRDPRAPCLGYARPIEGSVCQRHFRQSQELIRLMSGPSSWGGKQESRRCVDVEYRGDA